MRFLLKLTPALFVGAALALVVNPAPATAHGDEGVMEIIAAEQSGPAVVRIEVGVVYANDDDLAEEATVTADLAGPGGEAVAGISLPRIDGARYGAEIPVPAAGGWTVNVRSENPTAEIMTVVNVAAEPAPPTTSAAPPTKPPTTTTVASAPSTSSADEDGAGADEGDRNDDVEAPVIPLLVGGAVVVAGGTFVLVRRRG